MLESHQFSFLPTNLFHLRLISFIHKRRDPTSLYMSTEQIMIHAIPTGELCCSFHSNHHTLIDFSPQTQSWGCPHWEIRGPTISYVFPIKQNYQMKKKRYAKKQISFCPPCKMGSKSLSLANYDLVLLSNLTS